MIDVNAAATNPLVEITLATVFLIGIIIVHGMAMRTVTRRFSAAWVGVNALTPRWRVSLILFLAIGGMVISHLVETLIWSAPVLALGMLPTLRDSYFFVLESYTTLGAGTVDVPDTWRLVGPMIAMSGIFTFGWTGSVLVTIMNEIGKLDRTQATKDRRESVRREGGAE